MTETEREAPSDVDFEVERWTEPSPAEEDDADTEEDAHDPLEEWLDTLVAAPSGGRSTQRVVTEPSA